MRTDPCSAAKKKCADGYKASISMAIDRASVLSCVHCMLFSILR